MAKSSWTGEKNDHRRRGRINETKTNVPVTSTGVGFHVDHRKADIDLDIM